jgi:hypothetical protein
MPFGESNYFELVANMTAGILCTSWLQARRARSDAPYHDGFAVALFDSIANFGVQAKSS